MKKYRYKKGLFGMSADPITVGHIDIIRKSLEQCENVIVLVANNTQKRDYLFSLDERVQMVRAAIAVQFPEARDRITVLETTGLLVDVYLRENCDVIIRGVRHLHDESRENEQRALYTMMHPELADRFLYIQSTEALMVVSSSWVKDLTRLFVNIAPLVPLSVKAALEQRALNQVLVGVTGPMGNGKSFVIEQLIADLQAQNIPASVIAVDALVDELYREDSLGAQAIREQIAEKFGATVLSSDRKEVNRMALRTELFRGNPATAVENILWIQALTRPHVERLFRAARTERVGILFLEWADYVHINLLPWVNNTVIIVEADETIAVRRLVDNRNIPKEYATVVRNFQRSQEEMITDANQQILKAGHGHCLRIETNHNALDPFTVRSIVDQLSELYTPVT